MNFQQNKYYGEDNDETLLLDDYKKELDVAIDYTYPQKSSWKSSSEARALTLKIEEGSKKLWKINVPIRIVFAQKTLKRPRA